MAKKEKTIRTYPIHNPDDESSGMDLIDKKEKNPDVIHAGDEKWVSFKDFINQQNTFQGNKENKEVKEEFLPDMGGRTPTFSTGSGRLARKSSYKQPGQGKETIGSQGSKDAAFAVDPTKTLDINMALEKLSPEQAIMLKTYADQIDSTPEDLISITINKDISIQELFKNLERMMR